MLDWLDFELAQLITGHECTPFTNLHRIQDPRYPWLSWRLQTCYLWYTPCVTAKCQGFRTRPRDMGHPSGERRSACINGRLQLVGDLWEQPRMPSMLRKGGSARDSGHTVFPNIVRSTEAEFYYKCFFFLLSQPHLGLPTVYQRGSTFTTVGGLTRYRIKQEVYLMLFPKLVCSQAFSTEDRADAYCMICETSHTVYIVLIRIRSWIHMYLTISHPISYNIPHISLLSPHLIFFDIIKTIFKPSIHSKCQICNVISSFQRIISLLWYCALAFIVQSISTGKKWSKTNISESKEIPYSTFDQDLKSEDIHQLNPHGGLSDVLPVDSSPKLPTFFSPLSSKILTRFHQTTRPCLN